MGDSSSIIGNTVHTYIPNITIASDKISATVLDKETHHLIPLSYRGITVVISVNAALWEYIP